MEIHLTAELEQRLSEWAAASGRPAEELVREAVGGYLDDVAATRNMLDGRYDDIKSGKVQLIDGDEALARLRAKSEERRAAARG